MKRFLKYLIVFISIILIFMFLLTVSALFPSESIKNNVKESAKLLVQEGNRKETYIIGKFIIIQFDNYTDALMINTAYSIDNKTPLYSSLVNKKNYLPDKEQTIFEDRVGGLRSASKYKYHDEVHELNDTVNDDINESFEYARYWHGYLVLLRPLLLFFNLSHIRIILTIIFISLAIIVLFNIYKKLGLLYMISFLIGLFGIEYFYMGLSMQGCFIFLIMMIFMKIILERYDNIQDISLYFLIVGMLTNFFDFLTNPIVTLFVPLILFFLLTQKEKNINLKEIIFIFLKTGIAWSLGYALTWLSKWILVDIIFKKNVLQIAFQQIHFRANGIAEIGIINAITENLNYIIIPLAIDFLFIIVMMAINLNKQRKENTFKIYFLNILPYLIISLIPYIWYSLIKEHSYEHAFFTYREQILTMISIPIIYLKYQELNGVENEEKSS